MFESARAEGEKLSEKAAKDAEAECSKISAVAEKNRNKVIKSAAAILVS